MTQETQHTPTPWMLDPHFVLRDADGEWVTRLDTSRRHDNKHDPEAEANAEFIVRRLYKTAQARIGCAQFPAGAFVAVKFSHIGSNGVIWYEIDRTESGALDSPVCYPEHHLDRLTF
jgi:hypothetical protein